MPRAAESPTRNPVKLPGPVVTAMRSSDEKADASLLDDARDQRHQGFRMAPFHRLRFLREQFARIGVEHGGRAGVQRGIDGKDQHILWLVAPRGSFTASTSVATRQDRNGRDKSRP